MCACVFFIHESIEEEIYELKILKEVFLGKMKCASYTLGAITIDNVINFYKISSL